MMLLKVKIVIIIGVLIIGDLYFNEKVFGQYNKAEIQHAITKLRERHILDELVQMTETDGQLPISRGDVLVACYLVLLELDRLNVAGLRDELTRLDNTLKKLSTPVPGPKAIETNIDRELINRTVNEVQANMDRLQKVEKETENLNKALRLINENLKSTNTDKVDQLQKKTTYHIIISSLTVIASLAIAILAAR